MEDFREEGMFAWVFGSWLSMNFLLAWSDTYDCFFWMSNGDWS